MYVYVIKPSHLLEISPSVREKNKNGTDRFFDPATAPLERGKNRRGREAGQYSRREEFDEREFSLRGHVQTPERILSYAGDPFHRARHAAAPFGASVQRPWLLARGGANELRGSRFARNTWHLADATGCGRDDIGEEIRGIPVEHANETMFVVNLFFEISQFLFRTHPIDSCLVSYRSDIRGIFGEGNEII